MNVAFCINRLALLGFGATLLSLIRNCSDTRRLKLWLFCVEFSKKEKELITGFLLSKGFLGEFCFIDFAPKSVFGAFNGLHGDWTPYGRLLIAEFMNEDMVLYLDADLIVELDVLEVEHFKFKNEVLAAVGGGKFAYTLGNKFYTKVLGLSPNLDYFNSGVLILNLKKWRREGLTETCITIAKQYPTLPSHDQSILNVICAGSFARLPQYYNCEWLASNYKPSVSNRMIIHFVGSPKPWDFLGSVLHSGYHVWEKYQDDDWASSFRQFDMSILSRAWQIRRSYMRTIRSRLLNKYDKCN